MNTEFWWDGDARETYWLEITDRTDLGADLKSPQRDDAGHESPAYRLIQEVRPGDIVFHYKDKSICGASVAGGPLESREIVWQAHGTRGRARRPSGEPVAGWWLPIYGFTSATEPLTLASLWNPEDDAWIRGWITEKQSRFPVVHAPFQLYPGRLRGAQAYMAKMPFEFVERWPQLRRLAEAVAPLQDELAVSSPARPVSFQAGFRPKDDSSYEAVIAASTQVRTRRHETLVRDAGEALSHHAKVSNPHPVDLRIDAPVSVIVEAKIVGSRHPLFAIREAVGQLFEYGHFIGPEGVRLAILLNAHTTERETRYVEDALGLWLLHFVEGELTAGPKTAAELGLIGIAVNVGPPSPPMSMQPIAGQSAAARDSTS